MTEGIRNQEVDLGELEENRRSLLSRALDRYSDAMASCFMVGVLLCNMLATKINLISEPTPKKLRNDDSPAVK